MNNNYHTQLNKQSNMLNEIAANNQLLQERHDKTNQTNLALQQLQQLQNFQGTPINKTPNSQAPQNIDPRLFKESQLPSNAQINPQLMQLTPQQMLYVQQLAQQAQQNQLYLQQQQINSQPFQKSQQSPMDNDEIELSEPAIELKKQEPHAVPAKQVQPAQQDVPPAIPEGRPVKKMLPRHPHPPPYPIKMCPPPKQQSPTINYVVIPILLIIIFVILVHPKTSKMLEKYLPKMESMKGYVMRGAILAILYIAIKLATSTFSGKNATTKPYPPLPPPSQFR